MVGETESKLNAPDKGERLKALKEIVRGQEKPRVNPRIANNHIHTFYSFSPYSPALAAYKAYQSGLETMGIMDHDSVAGAWEFLQACEILGTHATVGFEMRVHIGKNYGRINNPDQDNHMYMAIHGIPHQNLDAFDDYLSVLRQRRNVRNRQMVEKINQRFAPHGIGLDFDRDVFPISKASEGGTITERHLLYALAQKIYDKFRAGEAVIGFVEGKLGIKISDKIKGYLLDEANPYKLYDLLGVLKSDTSFFYIPATDESPTLEDLVDVAKCMGAIVAYPYLGDVEESVTGDKRAQKFEDGYLEDLFKTLKEARVDAIAYMPSRNTEAQLQRVQKLCRRYGFFETSGEDINSPRQKFVCPMLEDPRYSHLVEATWALIGHEKCATKNLYDGMFTSKTVKRFPDLDYRIKVFAEIGRNF
jgi:predicted metal-dependent phosphoesterase TrpH